VAFLEIGLTDDFSFESNNEITAGPFVNRPPWDYSNIWLV
jgi:hypothetical protein